jgi:hypothetical protein
VKGKAGGQMDESRFGLFDRWAENYDDAIRLSDNFPYCGVDPVNIDRYHRTAGQLFCPTV